MRTSTRWILAGAVALGACETKTIIQPVPPDAPPGVVNVSAACTKGIAAGVNPWLRDVPHGGSVIWKMTGQADSLRITPDSLPPWPFANPEPSGTSEAFTGAMTNPPADSARLHYTITVFCDGLRLRIDPELIIPTT